MDLLWWGEEVVVAGPDTRAFPIGDGARACAGIRFAPGTLPALLGAPAVALRDQRVPLSELLPAAAVEQLAERLRTTARPGRQLERYAAELIERTDNGQRARRVDAVLSLITAGRPVAGIAEAVGCSDRQLHRLSLDCFGYGAKTLDRILRLHRALDLSRRGIRAAEVAIIAGYADQAHLVRDSRALTGRSFGALAGQRSA
jgi:AraC-like DNA-binding protein